MVLTRQGHDSRFKNTSHFSVWLTQIHRKCKDKIKY